jgi:hypothetical protein
MTEIMQQLDKMVWRGNQFADSDKCIKWNEMYE